MTPSRSDAYRRRSPLTPGRWALLIGGFLLFLLVLFVVTVRNADADYRRDEARAVATAKTEAGLKRIGSVSMHVWDETVWVVTGKDAEGVEWIVWERASGLVKEKLEDGLSEKRIRELFASQHPGSDIVRLLPGWFDNQPAWEIRYVADPDTGRQSIDFYAFKDGTKLKTYDLPGRTAG
jgi:uncharacterized protein YpmB